MADVFVSYARPDELQAKRVADALRSGGYHAWRDDELPAHRAYAEVIEERLKEAKAVVVLWSAEAAKSQWVRAEADVARAAGTLVQASLDQTIPPLPFNQIQCADLHDWDGIASTAGWSKLTASVAALAGAASGGGAHNRRSARSVSICVLPFQNMSGDAEQEYFSDGISEDITTDLSKISALEVIARNTAFQFKGYLLDVCEIAAKLQVTHVLEGSVRKAGGRVRITAQLIDGGSGGHVWAERYDRDLTDIFAIQDEISKAIVDALKIRLLPEEKSAIADRGTANVDAYNLYLKARQLWVGGTFAEAQAESIARICGQAILLDPRYAQAWALMALAQSQLRFWHGKDEDALSAAERALSIKPELPEPHCVKAHYLESEGQLDDANREIEIALEIDPESWEANREAARLMFRQGRVHESVPFYEKAAALMSTDHNSPSMLGCCYSALGDNEAAMAAARESLARAEIAVARDPANSHALAGGVGALAILGDGERARQWIRRGLLQDPENLSMRYNLACALCSMGDTEGALEVLQPFFERGSSAAHLRHLEADPDFDELRGNLRFQHLLTDAKKRLGIDETHPVIPAATSERPRS